ncbi:MAG: hypothetical protein DLM68_10010, partial [Hyphomicrobiales bacterium]
MVRHGVRLVPKVLPLHVGAYVEMLTRSQSAPAAQQRLAGKIGNTPKLWQLPSSYARPLFAQDLYRPALRLDRLFRR